jgi:hypothetical protein
MLNRKLFLAILLFSIAALISVESAYAVTYTLTVTAKCFVQNSEVNCVPPFPGSAVNSSGQITAGSSIHLAVTSPSYSGVPSGARWTLTGYLLWKDGTLQTPQPVNSNSFDLIMDANYNVSWVWYQEVNLTLTSNFGSPTLSGGGWMAAGGTVQISTESIFFNGPSQYLFNRWLVQSGNVSIANVNSPTTTATINSVSAIQAVFALVSSNMTNTYTTTITTVINGSTVTTTSTGIYAHNQVTVQLQIKDSTATPSLLANANVTVVDDAGQKVWHGFTDQSGLTQQFQVNPTLIYTVQVQYLGRNYATRQQFQASGSYPVDIAGSNPLISLQALAPYAIPMVVVGIIVVALVVYLNGRKAPSKPRVEWVSR